MNRANRPDCGSLMRKGGGCDSISGAWVADRGPALWTQGSRLRDSEVPASFTRRDSSGRVGG
jgi:hypothetical protein